MELIEDMDRIVKSAAMKKSYIIYDVSSMHTLTCWTVCTYWLARVCRVLFESSIKSPLHVHAVHL